MVSRTRQEIESKATLQYFSTNKDKFSVGVPHPEVITRAGLKELLAPSNPYKSNKLEGEGCYKCDAKLCDGCKNFLNFGNSFRAAATGRIFLILKSLTCTSSNAVYLAECVLCGLQGVGSTANFKSRLANYKSHIKHKRRTCILICMRRIIRA